jgi:hypothetical protein
MKKVVDAGALRSSALTEFLTVSTNNVVVLTDYGSMECFKGEGSINIRRSLEIISRFPQQVAILKSTATISRLRPRKTGLQNRFIDRKQTAGFPRYCSALFAVTANPEHVAYDTQLKSVLSREHFSRLEAKAMTMGEAWTVLFRSYTAADLKDLRAHRAISRNLSHRIIRDIFAVTARCFKDEFGVRDMPLVKDAIYSFPFRFAVCSYVLALHWAVRGGYQTATASRLRNDFTDATYASYATFFDGLITLDRKLNEINNISEWMLRNLLFPRPTTA